MHEKSENEISDLLFLKKQKPGKSALTDFRTFYFYLLHAFLSIGIHLSIVLLVCSARDALHPFFVVEIPANSFLYAFLKLQ